MYIVGQEEIDAIARVIRDGSLFRYGVGGECDRFERRYAEYLGTSHVALTCSGTYALTAAVLGLGIGPGDEVLVPAYTWMATAAAPVVVGAVPVLVDIDETLTIDPADIERKITPYTRAIMPVHMLNLPCNMDAIMAIAKKHKLLVIEDACQAVGVRYKDRYCGAIGHAGAFSFNAYKNINIGEGGAVITSEDKIFARARQYHDLGAAVRNHEETFNEPAFVGMNMRVTEIEGAMLGVQLSRLGPMMKRLRKRRQAVEPILAASGKFRVSPHHDPDNAVSLTVIFDREEDAIEFSKRRGVTRLYDNSKHIYTNWEAILCQRTFHPKLNPWAWTKRKITYDIDMCAKTLDILQRTCRVGLGQQYPVPLMRYMAQRLVA